MAYVLSRRLFLTRLGKAGVAVGILGVAACGGDDEILQTTTTGPPGTQATTSSTAAGTTTTTAATTTTTADATTTEAPAQGAVWERVNLGFVSAYVAARAGEGLVVDTGTQGSADAIEAVLGIVGLAWADVGHVVLTHLHPDHVGSLTDVMGRAADAKAYAGEADIGSIPSPRPIAAVADGDNVFDLQIIETPGHTPGHISVFDPDVGVVVAGDALNGANGGLVGANPNFTSDMDLAGESIKKLAALPDVQSVLMGHGEPVLTDGGSALAELAASL